MLARQLTLAPRLFTWTNRNAGNGNSRGGDGIGHERRSSARFPGLVMMDDGYTHGRRHHVAVVVMVSGIGKCGTAFLRRFWQTSFEPGMSQRLCRSHSRARFPFEALEKKIGEERVVGSLERFDHGLRSGRSARLPATRFAADETDASVRVRRHGAVTRIAARTEEGLDALAGIQQL